MTPSSSGFRSVIDELTRERLADGVVCAIENCFGPHAMAEDNDSIPRPFRLVHVVYQTTGFLAGDGLDGLLHLPCKMSYPTYLHDLGFHDLAQTLERYIHENSAYDDANTRKVEQELYRNTDKIYISIGEYIVNNSVAFEPLLPHLPETLAYLEHFDPAEHARRLSAPDPYQERLKAVLAALNGEMSLEEALKILDDNQNG